MRSLKTLDRLNTYLDPVEKEFLERNRECVFEIRLRTGRQMQIIGSGIDEFIGRGISCERMRSILSALMDFSVYAREEEIRQGYFTMPDGCRVGICGRVSMRDGKISGITHVGSISIRIAREVVGCGKKLVPHLIQNGNLNSLLIASMPGMGKTTCLRDIARILSEKGYLVAIADERQEIAICRQGNPSVNVGNRTDIMYGCPKWMAIGQMIRSMSPQVIITDEIGCREDVQALMDAKRCGIAVIASAHGNNITDLQKRTYIGEMIKEGIFSSVAFFAESPGKLREICEL